MPSQYEALAREALLDVTAADTIGGFAGEKDEGDGVVSVLFDALMPGYPGWKWTVSVAHLDGSEPTVLEAELMPQEGALLAPDWVPWSDRLADYKAAQEAIGGDPDSVEDVDPSQIEPLDDSDEPDDDSGDDDDDPLDSDVLHSGDLDGVDIDDFDDDGDDDDDDDDDAASSKD